MSFLNKLVKKKKADAQRAPSLPEVINRLRATEDGLLKQQNSLEERIKKEIATAKQNSSTNKKVALQAVQKKKRLERQLQHVDGALTRLEAQREVLESANINSLVVSSMEKTSRALKNAHKDLDADGVNKIFDDLADQRDVSEEISEAISHPVGFQDEDIDDEELERELAELEESLGDLNIEKQLPSVPQDDSDQKRTVSEDPKKRKKEKEKVPVAS